MCRPSLTTNLIIKNNCYHFLIYDISSQWVYITILFTLLYFLCVNYCRILGISSFQRYKFQLNVAKAWHVLHAN